MLQSREHEVVAITTDPRNGIELVKLHAPDAFVMDLGYTGGPGEDEVFGVIEQLSSITNVIVMSGSDTPDRRRRAQVSGASAFASKGLDSEVLLKLIEGGTAEPPPLVKARRPGNDRYFLTDREWEVLASLMEGDSTARIAERLGVRTSTARSHVQSVLMKLGVHNRVAAVSLGVKERLITPGV